jgi:GNAT superfamily N-acetyltransferase
MSVELKTVSRADAEIWHGMMTEELFNLPVEEAQNILIADDPVQTLEIRGDGKRVGFVAVNFQPRSVPDVLWVFVRKEDRRRGWATAAVDWLVERHRAAHLQTVPRAWAEGMQEAGWEVEGLEGNDDFVDVTVRRAV